MATQLSAGQAETKQEAVTKQESGTGRAAANQQAAAGQNQDKLDHTIKEISAELRCLVCQNQSIADSTAPLAVDLKQQIREQLQAGRKPDEIKTYMVERYGEFVLYKPAFNAANAMLWAGPFVLLLVAVVVARRWLRQQAKRKDLSPITVDEHLANTLEQHYRQSSAESPSK